MKTKIVRVGNSRGIRIPKALLEETGLSGDVILEAKGDHLEIRPAPKHPRETWEEAARRVHEAGQDYLGGWTDGPGLTAWDEEEWEWPESDFESTSSSSNPPSGARSGRHVRASSSRRRK